MGSTFMKLIHIASASLLALSLAACGGDDETSGESAPAQGSINTASAKATSKTVVSALSQVRAGNGSSAYASLQAAGSAAFGNAGPERRRPSAGRAGAG